MTSDSPHETTGGDPLAPEPVRTASASGCDLAGSAFVRPRRAVDPDAR